MDRLTAELKAQAPAVLSHPEKYGEGLDKKQDKASLDPTTAKPIRSMTEVLAQLKLKTPEKYFVCHHCGKITRSPPPSSSPQPSPQPVAALGSTAVTGQ